MAFNEESIRGLYASCVGNAGDRFGISQLQQVLRSMGVEALSSAELEEMMGYLDHDGDGVVSENDFVVVMADYLTKMHAASGGLGSSSDMGDGRSGSAEPSFDLSSSLSQGDDERSVFKAMLSQQLSRMSRDPKDCDTILHVVDSYVDARISAKEEQLAHTTHLYEQERKRNEMLQREGAVVVEEYQRLEQDVAHVPALQRRLDESSAQAASLLVKVETLTAEVARLTESESRLRSLAERHEGEVVAAAQRMESRDRGLEEQLRRLEVDRNHIASEFTVAQRDRSVLEGECHALQAEVTRLRLKLAEGDKLRQENMQLREAADELRMALSSKEEQIDRLQASIEDMQNNSDHRPGSILNEIEDLVMAQMRGGPTTPLATAMSQLMPDSSIHSSLSMMTPFTSPHPSKAHGLASPPSSATCPVPSPTKLAALEGSRGSCVTLGGGSDASGSSGIGGGRSNLPSNMSSHNASSVNLMTPGATPAPSTTPLFAASGRALSMSVESLYPLAEGDESVVVIPKEDLRDMVDPSKLEACLRMVAASTQHLAGRKIVTPASAATLDATTLMTLRDTMLGLIHARSERLTEALQERDRLAHELEVKRAIIVPVIGLVRAGSVSTPDIFPRDHHSPTRGRGSPSPVPIADPSPRASQPSSASRWKFWGGGTPIFKKRGSDGTELQV